ncbi:MAG: type B 50S ribosomal protein L31 [Flammeovirgaceae bacterium]
MKKDIHPEYREVVFKDLSSEESFITRSTVATSETIDIDGTTYPLVKVEISSASHPFYTGKDNFVSRAGRVEKFNKKYKRK